MIYIEYIDTLEILTVTWRVLQKLYTYIFNGYTNIAYILRSVFYCLLLLLGVFPDMFFLFETVCIQENAVQKGTEFTAVPVLLIPVLIPTLFRCR